MTEHQARLLAWGDSVRRDLPWRRTRDPWAILVSELMLQQTQVARVVPKYEAFLESFPTLAACARAPRSAIVEAWAGLGYNRRAVNLHRTAEAVVDDHAGSLPTTLDELLALPGIGPYTARAVLVFAHEADIGVVDTNVGRLYARWGGEPLSAKAVQALADATVPAGEGWAWNQSLFDLGATVCLKRQPKCGACPVAASCAWRGEGDDPAVGSAGVSGGQSRFEGSDRQGRGRLVDALRSGRVARDRLAEAAGWPGEEARAEAMLAGLIHDGLAEADQTWIQLPS